MTQNPFFPNYLQERREFIDKALESYFSEIKYPSDELFNAMKYSLSAGGKRIRPVFMLMICESLGVRNEGCLKAGCAFELLHTYSLIHDDLPSMDNDDFRRGKPTCHKVYGEAMAILAGDALQAMAFEWMSGIGKLGIETERVLRALSVFSKSAGLCGMAGGQALDLVNEGKVTGLDTLRNIHLLKTGALISACSETSAIISGCPEEQIVKFREFGEKIGLLFQVIDDILDNKGTLEELGKTPGKDAAAKKVTYVSLLGMDGAQKIAAETEKEALNILTEMHGLTGVENAYLSDFTRYIANRVN
ncbi:MAG: polyprenyl synthetase family protein [Candidatus Riflebacteria bacterium]|nr:polyprenyl synthetase family protein [Candidatus Riflebacteria bacterium]